MHSTYLYLFKTKKIKSLITNFYCAIFFKVLVIYNFYKHSAQILKLNIKLSVFVQRFYQNNIVQKKFRN